MLRVTSRAVLPFALLVAVYLFLRGHNQPGGGFVAGLVTAVALIVQYLASGINWTEHRLDVRFYRIAGRAPRRRCDRCRQLLLRRTLSHQRPRPSAYTGAGEVPLASAALFDLGVYLTVVGAMVLSLTALSHVNRNRTI